MVHSQSERFNKNQVKFITKDELLLSKVELQIDKENDKYKKTQLVTIKNELIHMKNNLNDKTVDLQYPRIIVDSWDYTDELGIELLQLAEDYKKISIKQI